MDFSHGYTVLAVNGCCQEMGPSEQIDMTSRQDIEQIDLTTDKILYACMRCADIIFVKLLEELGMDQWPFAYENQALKCTGVALGVVAGLLGAYLRARIMATLEERDGNTDHYMTTLIDAYFDHNNPGWVLTLEKLLAR
ncbi:transport protein Sec23-like protein [Tanacetum coccineum]